MKNQYFCASCFASEDSASYCGIAMAGHCTNCGSGGTTFMTPDWAINEIRRTASWVGKRYYPDDEDLQISEELKFLRSKMKLPADRTAELINADDSLYQVTQIVYKNGLKTSIGVFIKATSEAEALEKTKTSLPYVENT